MNVILTESEWVNSQLSVARYYGGISIDGEEFLIVNKNGITLEQLSDPDSKYYVVEGKAIAPGELADLINKKFIKEYKKLGRGEFLKKYRK